MRTLALASIAVAATMACGDDTGTTPPPPVCTVSAVTVTGGNVSRFIGETVQLTAQVASADCATPPAVTWSSQPAGRVTVSASGLVTAVSAGTVTVTATAGGVNGSAQLLIIEPPPGDLR